MSDTLNKNLCDIFDIEYHEMEFENITFEGKCPSAFEGLHHTEETKRILSEKNLGQNNPMFGVRGVNHPLYGKSSAMLGRFGGNHPMFGHKMSADSKEKIRQHNMGENNPMFGKKHPIVQCPFCGKKGAMNGMKRWHFENCRNAT